jgi:hypothetical protein
MVYSLIRLTIQLIRLDCQIQIRSLILPLGGSPGKTVSHFPARLLLVM